MLSASATLALPLLLGLLVGWRGWLGNERVSTAQAIAAINRFALLVAFPALVVASFLDPSRDARLDLVVPFVAGLPLLVGVGAARSLAGRRSVDGPLAGRAPLALVALFGNSAYLGLPLIAAVYDDGMLPTASAIVSLHVAMAVTLGTALLAQETGHHLDGRGLAKKLASSPLAWAPVVGVALATLLDLVGMREEELTIALFRGLEALGRTASPTGLFVLGVFLAGRPLAGLWRGQMGFVVVRLIIVPAAALVACVVATRLGAIDPLSGQVVVLLSAVPAAISTFPMVEDAGLDPEPVARAIVTTSVVSIVTVPLWVFLAAALVR